MNSKMIENTKCSVVVLLILQLALTIPVTMVLGITHETLYTNFTFILAALTIELLSFAFVGYNIRKRIKHYPYYCMMFVAAFVLFLDLVGSNAPFWYKIIAVILNLFFIFYAGSYAEKQELKKSK